MKFTIAAIVAHGLSFNPHPDTVILHEVRGIRSMVFTVEGDPFDGDTVRVLVTGCHDGRGLIAFMDYDGVPTREWKLSGVDPLDRLATEVCKADATPKGVKV